MSEYRLYLFRAGHIRQAETLEFADDAEAVAYAEAKQAGEVLELWQGARMVGRLEPMAAPPQRGGSSSRASNSTFSS